MRRRSEDAGETGKDDAGDTPEKKVRLTGTRLT